MGRAFGSEVLGENVRGGKGGDCGSIEEDVGGVEGVSTFETGGGVCG